MQQESNSTVMLSRGLHGVCMFSWCICGISLDTTASSHSLKTWLLC